MTKPTDPKHAIKVRAKDGAFYAECSCGNWQTSADYYSRASAREVGRDHLCETPR
jgi:hypothetical protein